MVARHPRTPRTKHQMLPLNLTVIGRGCDSLIVLAFDGSPRETVPTSYKCWCVFLLSTIECPVLAPWKATDKYAVAVENLPDVRGYATSDLFIPHPTREGLWKM